MEFERYEDVIDAYERDNMGYATLTDYIKGENIKIKEIEVDPLGDLKQSLKKGGPVGIEVLIMEKMKDGGRVPFRFGGAMGSRYGGGSKSGPSQGPAGGASAGGNYGGNRNPQQTYGGSIFRGGGGGPRPGTGSAGPAGGATKKITPTTQNFGVKALELAKKYNPLNLVFGTPAFADDDIEKQLDELRKQKGLTTDGGITGAGGTQIPNLEDPRVMSNIAKTVGLPTEKKKFKLGDDFLKTKLDYPTSKSESIIRDIQEYKREGVGGDATLKLNPKEIVNYYGSEGKFKGLDVEKVKSIYDMVSLPNQTFVGADGGRVGFNVGGITDPQALAIYNSMSAYGFSDKEIADTITAQGYDAGTLGQTTTPTPTTLTTPTTPTPSEGIIGIDLQQRDTGGGRDDNKTGFGKFGNLDPTTERTFVKDVYTIDRNAAPGAPMTGSFKPTEVTGYLNVNTGNYQTFEGKNINHGGIPIKPGIAAIAEALGFGPIDETQFTGLPYREGYIAGTFTGKNPLDFFKKQQATIAEINAMNQKAIKDMQAKKAAEEAAKRRELENRIISGGANIGGGGGGGNITTRAGTFAPGDYSDVAGTLADPREKMDFYRDGGLVSMFVEKR